MDKNGLRNLGKLLREDGKKEGFCRSAYRYLKDLGKYKEASCVMIYLNLPKEAPTDELIEKILADGKRVLVPVTDGNVITPAEINGETLYKTGAFGVREPVDAKFVSENEIDIVLAPGLLFDKRGNRVGYGKGCYDLFFEKVNPVKIGIGFSNQFLRCFPSELHDVKMDYIITEKGMIVCEK